MSSHRLELRFTASEWGELDERRGPTPRATFVKALALAAMRREPAPSEPVPAVATKTTAPPKGPPPRGKPPTTGLGKGSFAPRPKGKPGLGAAAAQVTQRAIRGPVVSNDPARLTAAAQALAAQRSSAKGPHRAGCKCKVCKAPATKGESGRP